VSVQRKTASAYIHLQVWVCSLKMNGSVEQIRTQNFSLGGGGADPAAIICLILNIVLKSWPKYDCNVTLFATTFICTRI
jgi:hypothetical protein